MSRAERQAGKQRAHAGEARTLHLASAAVAAAARLAACGVCVWHIRWGFEERVSA